MTCSVKYLSPVVFVVAALAEAESAEEDEERQAGVQDHGLSWAGPGQEVVVTGSFCHISVTTVTNN